MSEVVLYIAMSLDGYIAESNGNISWLGGDGSEPDNQGSYPEFIETVDTIILGYTTYHQLVTELAPEGWVYPDKKTYVMTHQKLQNCPEISFTDENLAELIRRLKAEGGQNIWICGGSAIINQVLAADLIDRFCITVIPILLGDGIRLFTKQEDQRLLKFVSTRTYNGMTDLVFEKRK
ncbi:dihydrofolate reductase family protein [Eubacteriaceae bacterium ES3]|nr:dihydrofolate reductase family protein [Eubacteriaceae bacterium ES3]